MHGVLLSQSLPVLNYKLIHVAIGPWEISWTDWHMYTCHLNQSHCRKCMSVCMINMIKVLSICKFKMHFGHCNSYIINRLKCMNLWSLFVNTCIIKPPINKTILTMLTLPHKFTVCMLPILIMLTVCIPAVVHLKLHVKVLKARHMHLHVYSIMEDTCTCFNWQCLSAAWMYPIVCSPSCVGRYFNVV